MKRIGVMLLAGTLAGLIACSGSRETGAGSDAQTLRFAVIPKSLDLPVFNYAKIGAERAAAQLGNVEIIWRAAETADQRRQAGGQCLKASFPSAPRGKPSVLRQQEAYLLRHGVGLL